MIPGQAQQFFEGAAGGAGGDFQIDRSLRFNSADSAYLSRTPSAASNRRTFTWSGWVKRSGLGVNQSIFGTRTGSSDADILDLFFANGNYGTTKDALTIGRYSFYDFITNALFRDESAWYHIVLAYDTTQATASNRIKLYVNGNEQTFSSVTYPALNAELPINRAVEHEIGGTDPTNYLNGNLTEVHFVDGQQLAASDFGETNSDGIWVPIEFAGSYTSTSTSTTLSQTGWTVSSPTSENNIWDGNTSTVSNGYNGGIIGTVSFSPPLTNVTKVEVYQQNYHHYLNGSQVTTPESGTTWHTLYDNSSSPITLNSVGNSYTNNTQSVDIMAIRINGSVVNSKTWTPPSGVGVQDGGLNSFYLKFADNSSNAALGTDSSGNSNTWTVNNLTATASGATSFSSTNVTNASSILDGNTGTAATFTSTNAVFDAACNISGITNLEFMLYGGVSGVGQMQYRVNGSSYTNAAFPNDNSYPWNNATSLLTNGTLTSFGFKLSGAANGGARAIRYTTSAGTFYITSTPGRNIDSLLDTPTNYDDGTNVGGNYATLNSLHNGQTLSNGNLDVVGTSSWQRSVSTIAMSSGKYYWEYEITASNEHIIGVGPLDMQMSGNLGAGSPPGSGYGTEFGQVNGTGANGSWSNTGGSTTGDLIGVAFDADAGNMYIYKNGTALNSGIASHTGLTNGPYYAVFSLNGSSRSGSVNFGQRSFSYPPGSAGGPSSDYKSLCTTNLPDPTIADGSTAFDVALWTGNGGTQTISGLNLSPDFVWIKNRSNSYNHHLLDTVRGANDGQNVLYSNLTNAEGATNSLLDFTSDGFTVGSNSSVNHNSSAIVGWAWDAGTSTVSNTDGSITSQVRASQTNGISVVSYTGTGTSATVGHSLNAAPAIYIIKSRGSVTDWQVSTTVIDGSHDYLQLNTTSAKQNSGRAAPTSSVLSIGSGSVLNASGVGFIAYCFAPVNQFSSFGSYIGNGSADGPFVYTGMRPRWLLIKRTDSTASWHLYDTARGSTNVVTTTLDANTNSTESSFTSGYDIDLLSNGFKARAASSNAINASSGTYLYLAFAEHPYKTARAR